MFCTVLCCDQVLAVAGRVPGQDGSPHFNTVKFFTDCGTPLCTTTIPHNKASQERLT